MKYLESYETENTKMKFYLAEKFPSTYGNSMGGYNDFGPKKL
jgi:hypothetical protein